MAGRGSDARDILRRSALCVLLRKTRRLSRPNSAMRLRSCTTSRCGKSSGGALLQLAERNLDLQWMARESLGDHWNEITPAERDEFVTLFTVFIEEAYLTRIQDYVELKIDVRKARLLRPNYAEVDGDRDPAQSRGPADHL